MYQRILAKLCLAYDAEVESRDKSPMASWKVEERAQFLAELRTVGATSLIEIGSGPGRDGLFFQHNGLSVVCTDPSAAMVERCRAKGLDARQMDVLHLDFAPASFDAAYALNSLLHVPRADMPTALASVREVLRPGGLFYMGVYGGTDGEGIYEGDHYEPKRFFSRYTDEGLQALARRFFTVVTFCRTELDGQGDIHHQGLILRRATLERPAPLR